MSQLPGPVGTLATRNWIIWALGCEREFHEVEVAIPDRLLRVLSARRVTNQDPEVLRQLTANFLAAQPVDSAFTQEVVGLAAVELASTRERSIVTQIGAETDSGSGLKFLLAVLLLIGLVGTTLSYVMPWISAAYYAIWAIDLVRGGTDRQLLSVVEQPELGWLTSLGVMFVCWALVCFLLHRYRGFILNRYQVWRGDMPLSSRLMVILNDWTSYLPASISVPKMEFDNGTLPTLITNIRDGASFEPAYMGVRSTSFQQTGPKFGNLPIVVYSSSATNINYAIAGRVLVPVPNVLTMAPVTVRTFTVARDGSWQWTTVARPVWDLVISAMVDGHWARSFALVQNEPRIDTWDWINRRQLSRQKKRYTDAMRRLQVMGGHENIRGFYSRTAFAKGEKTFDSTKLPRAIIGSTDEFQVCCGPEVERAGRVLHTLCDTDVAGRLKIRWTEGWTSARLTQEFNLAVTRATAANVPVANGYTAMVVGCDRARRFLGSITIFVLGDDNLIVYADPFTGEVKYAANDLTKYDSTHNSQSWRAAKQFYKAIGMYDEVIGHLKRACSLRGKSVKGGYFTSKWNMPSGNPDTCLRNSLINIFFTASWFYYVLQHSILREHFVLRGPSVRGSPILSLEEWITRCGFLPKLKVSGDVRNVDFLGGIFLARDNGTGFEWVPKVFRLIHRLSYCVDSRMDAVVYNRAVAECYQAWQNVPVLGQWVQATLARNVTTNSAVVEELKREQLAYKLTPSHCQSVTNAFLNHYGLGVFQLERLNNTIRDCAGMAIEVSSPDFEACFQLDLA
jgi:hypothetical protein